MKFKNSTANEVQQWLNNDEAIILDVREPAEFSNKHI